VVSGKTPPSEISSPADWEAAQEVFDGFHDAVVRSLTFVNDHRVRSDAAMEWWGDAVLRAIIQTQSREHPGGEITFHGVYSVTFEHEGDVQPGEATRVKTSAGDCLRFRFSGCDVVARAATVTPLTLPESEARTPVS
jgi:hypothetical protein